ncbi:MAG: hypothetical protein IT164_17920 [Bryobacterales bacterium]|nr:hypothetical protein [Bryobacterales bacterium]
MRLILALFAMVTASQAAVILGGTNHDGLKAALDTAGITYSEESTMFPDPSGLGAGDYIILSNDGGLDPGADYTAFLNAGGRLVMTGGSNDDAFRTWLSGYFNLTDTASGWHTDGDWHKAGPHPLTSLLPNDYTFENNSATYHMTGFLPGTDTTFLGQNDEPFAIAAVRTYANGGYFYYMALDIGANGYTTANDQANFVVPFVRSLNIEATSEVPEPATFTLTAAALLGLAGVMRRRA